MDWEELLAVSLGLLNWSPDTFWGATVFEFSRAVEGFNRANGGTKTPSRRGLKQIKAFMDMMQKKGLA
jgi:hypothetical protein